MKKTTFPSCHRSQEGTYPRPFDEPSQVFCAHMLGGGTGSEVMRRIARAGAIIDPTINADDKSDFVG
jgi:hypothetical protein